MARVVQRRTSPPYLLIVFVFLFLIATTVAVLMYMGKDALIQDKDKLTAAVTKANSTNAQARQDLAALAEAVTGVKDDTFENAAKQAAALREKAKDKATGTNMIAMVDSLLGQKTALEAEIASLKIARDAAVAEKAKALDAQAKSQVEATAATDALTKANAEVAKSSAAYQADQQAKIDAITKEHQKIVSEDQKRINSLNLAIQQLQTEKQGLLSKIDGMIVEFRNARLSGVDFAKDTTKAKGKISEVLEGQKIVYINRGSQDQITPGLTFSVYGPNGIPEDGKGKATIVVNNVSNTVSECKIVTQTLNNPITRGDLIGNVVYDPTRTFNFVVKGDFDLHKTNKPTAEGAQEVKSLIIRSGGKVSDDVSVTTDFLILGDEPARPAKLDEAATPQDQAVYQAQMKAYEDYKRASDTAAQFYIPRLDTNRFIGLVGFTPEKK